MYLILSNGHSATRWITNILSKEHFSKCFHSTSLLEVNPKIKNIISYHKYLREYNKNKKLVVGSIHLPFDFSEESLNELKNDNVKIFCLIRNPIDKINSMMQFYLEKFVLDGFFTKKKNLIKSITTDKDLYVDEILKNYYQQINFDFLNYQKSKNFYNLFYVYDSIKFKINKKFFNFKIKKELLEKANLRKYLSKVTINLFLFACSSCLRFDKKAKNFDEKKIILFEDIVKSEKNFEKFAKLLDSKFSLQNLNIENFENKIGKNVSDYNKTKFWPKSFKDYFLKRIEEKNLIKFYNKMNYQIY